VPNEWDSTWEIPKSQPIGSLSLRDPCAAETLTKGNPHKDKETRKILPPNDFKRTSATVNHYIPALSPWDDIRGERVLQEEAPRGAALCAEITTLP
jgi:hypothetical protein